MFTLKLFPWNVEFILTILPNFLATNWKENRQRFVIFFSQSPEKNMKTFTQQQTSTLDVPLDA